MEKSTTVGVRRGVSKRVEDNCRPPALVMAVKVLKSRALRARLKLEGIDGHRLPHAHVSILQSYSPTYS
jgi:hypothetical protein